MSYFTRIYMKTLLKQILNDYMKLYPKTLGPDVITSYLSYLSVLLIMGDLSFAARENNVVRKIMVLQISQLWITDQITGKSYGY